MGATAAKVELEPEPFEHLQDQMEPNVRFAPFELAQETGPNPEQAGGGDLVEPRLGARGSDRAPQFFRCTNGCHDAPPSFGFFPIGRITAGGRLVFPIGKESCVRPRLFPIGNIWGAQVPIFPLGTIEASADLIVPIGNTETGP